MLPPEYTHLAMDSAKLNLSPSLECDEVSHWEQRFPSLQAARDKAIEIIQGAGEALFVPSGWAHSVENLEDTISINHNWLNGFNVLWSANLLCHTFTKAIELLCDCRCAILNQREMHSPACDVQHVLIAHVFPLFANEHMAHVFRGTMLFFALPHDT